MFRVVSLFVVLVSVAACGGGNSGGGGLGPGAGGGNNDPWQQGVFANYLDFYARCENPRTTNNPISGDPWPDIQGSTLDENNFLRSYSNDTYLWYDEIVDQNPAQFDDPLTYFAELKTNELSPSGQPKDRFHFTRDTDEFLLLSQAGVSAGYGIQWALFQDVENLERELRVAFTEPNSPASNAAPPVTRGAMVFAIDGVDIEDFTQAGVAVLNAGMRPADVGEQHTFTILDQGAQSLRDVVLTSEEVVREPVQNVQVIPTATGDVGYMTFTTHIVPAEQALIDAVNQLNAHNNGAGIDDLILDLRYNGGGRLDIASEAAYMIAGPTRTAGKTFEEVQFNDKYPDTDPITGQPLVPVPFFDTGIEGQVLPTLNLDRVFVLSGTGTASASESIINGLRGIGVDVYLIGSTTTGKPYAFYPTDNCGTTYFTIQLRGVNDLGFGDYSDGFTPANSGDAGEPVPGCSVADDFTRQLGDQAELRLAAALTYRDSQTCPVASGLGSGAPASLGESKQRKYEFPMSVWESNRILTTR
jgi:C-terminal processing protease CtpA/Prc